MHGIFGLCAKQHGKTARQQMRHDIVSLLVRMNGVAVQLSALVEISRVIDEMPTITTAHTAIRHIEQVDAMIHGFDGRQIEAFAKYGFLGGKLQYRKHGNGWVLLGMSKDISHKVLISRNDLSHGLLISGVLQIDIVGAQPDDYEISLRQCVDRGLPFRIGAVIYGAGTVMTA